MTDGWYRITWPKPLNRVTVEHVVFNSSQSGGVRTLMESGCSYEAVEVLSKMELEKTNREYAKKVCELDSSCHHPWHQ